MSTTTDFNPIATARIIEQSYREYIASTIHFDNKELQAQLEGILSKTGFLSKGPILEAAPPYHKDETPAQLIEDGILCKSMSTLGGGDPRLFDLDRPLYAHQVQAIKKAVQGRNYAVVTGTGSGKTECFLLPILNSILKEFEADGVTPGVRAMILYPMNALANDQLKRLRELLKGTDITFGRYTGDTEEEPKKAVAKWLEENPGAEPLPNEILSRREIRENPPHILLTNYSMLEYLLLRPEDAPLFGSVFGQHWRHLAIDEAHIYSGSLGTEIAYLIRRLKARISSECGKHIALQCYATSATIGTKEDMPKVAEFASDLFGEPFSSDPADLDVITSTQDRAENALDPTCWGTLDLDCWADLNKCLNNPDSVSEESLRELLSQHDVPANIIARMDGSSPLLGLGKVLLGEETTRRIVKKCVTPLDLTDYAAIDSLRIDGINGDETGGDLFASIIEVLSTAERSQNVPLLSSRYHFFLRAPEGIFLNLRTGKLTPNKTTSSPYDDSHATPVYEASVCRHCGQPYILGTEKSDEESRCAWLDPKRSEFDFNEEFIPLTYYRLLQSGDDRGEKENVQWICPICGSISDDENAATHRFPHESCARIPVAKGEADKSSDEFNARCTHCGYQSRVAIQPMRVSPEAAGSVVCYELVREVPAFSQAETSPDAETESNRRRSGRRRLLKAKTATPKRRPGNVICFSDKRQDAAYFAPSFERTYNKITHRQLIREAVEKLYDKHACTPVSAQEIVRWIASKANPHRDLFDTDEADNKKLIAEAWVIDELEAEDSRNSLDGLGSLRLEPVAFDERICNDNNIDLLEGTLADLLESEYGNELGWLDLDAYTTILRFCLETIRRGGGVAQSDEVELYRQNHMKKPNKIVATSTGAKFELAFVGQASGSENARSKFIRKYAQKVHGITVGREASTQMLKLAFEDIYDILDGTYEDDSLIVGDEDSYLLKKGVWGFTPRADSDLLYRCDICGCESHVDYQGVCPTNNCNGTPTPLTAAEANEKDRYYKDIYATDALPIHIEEHTAQLSRENAGKIQSKFIEGNVNVLSCTTTFELGVDVGDLRAVFMRNVPPTAANYTQRAGRVGRRAGKPGFVVTFARLRPHDMDLFAHPQDIIGGATRVPACYLDNSAIAGRHLYAIALSEYFRHKKHPGEDCSCAKCYNDFMTISEEQPHQAIELNAYLRSNPDGIATQIDLVFPQESPLRKELGIDSQAWIGSLLDKGDDAGNGIGRLTKAHAIIHGDYQRLYRTAESCKHDNPGKAATCNLGIDHLNKEQTISVLSENGVLPKYGFPTDLATLHLASYASANEDLSLTRGLSQAIREYAPGNETIAGKILWRSSGIRPYRDCKFEQRYYGKCPHCETFISRIDNRSDEAECPICKSPIRLGSKMIIPSYGFWGEKVKDRRAGERKPRSYGGIKVQVSPEWRSESQKATIVLPGGKAESRYAGNVQICALNEGHGGFKVCTRCGAASPEGRSDKTPRLSHSFSCKQVDSKPFVEHISALGTIFTSDALELTLTASNGIPDNKSDLWPSLLWTLFTAAAQILQVPETELGGTWYPTGTHEIALMIYDNVPGGAGHAAQLKDCVQELIERAYLIVDGHCGCSEDTCCSGCIASYYNQNVQSILQRGLAKQYLGKLLGLSDETHDVRADNSNTITVRGGNMPDKKSFSDCMRDQAARGTTTRWKKLMIEIAKLAEGEVLEPPYGDADMFVSSAKDDIPFNATLAWPRSRVVLLSEEDDKALRENVDDDGPANSSWTIFDEISSSAQDILEALR